MSAAATVLHFRYNAPRACCPVNPKTHPGVQRAQALLDTGLHNAESEMRAAGYDRETAQHLVRMVLLHAFDAFSGETIHGDAVLLGLRDRLDRECWIRGRLR